MSISYRYANLTRKEWFSSCALGGCGNRHGFGRNLTSRAFELLLISPLSSDSASDPVGYGRWAGDSITIIGDTDDSYLEFAERFTDLYADLIPLIRDYDGFDELGELAAGDDRLYVQICHLIVTRQVNGLEADMKRKFGANYWQRYKDVFPKLNRFEMPRDLIHTPKGA